MTSTERSYGGRTTAERVAERRERLVRAVVTVLDERGVGRTTMTAVCAEAGLTERYFYESFSSLDDALAATLDAVSEEILALAADVVARTGGSAQERVRAVMRAVVDMVVERPATVRVAVVHSAADPRLRARRDALLAVFADFVARESLELYGPDAWPPARARAHGLVYVAGFSELVASWLAGDVALDAEELVETAADLFSATCRRTPPAASSGAVGGAD